MPRSQAQRQLLTPVLQQLVFSGPLLFNLEVPHKHQDWWLSTCHLSLTLHALGLSNPTNINTEQIPRIVVLQNTVPYCVVSDICRIERHLCHTSCWISANQHIVRCSFPIKLCPRRRKQHSKEMKPKLIRHLKMIITYHRFYQVYDISMDDFSYLAATAYKLEDCQQG